MSPETTSPRVHRFEPPLRRVLAVDAGTRCIRLLLLESQFGRLRWRGYERLDLQEEGLVAAEELQAHLHKTLAEWGRPPVALTVSQQVAVSQLIQLPPVSDAEARQLIAAETIKLAGLNESAVIHDFCRVPVDRPGRQGFWVTFAQEAEVEAGIARLGFEAQEFREISTSANALLTAWQTTQPPQAGTVGLVDLGAAATTVVLVQQGHGVLAASFPVAGDYFTQALARLRQCSPEQAEVLKRNENVLTGPHAVAGFAEVVRNWAAELQRQLQEWRPLTATQSEVVWRASGGGFAQPGLREFLAAELGLRFEAWPAPAAERNLPPIPPAGEIACGLALMSLRRGPVAASLLPEARRRAWRQRLNRQRWEFANTLLLGVVLLVLLLGIGQKFAQVRYKEALAEKVQAGLEAWQQYQQLSVDLVAGYDQLRPLLERQQATHDTLQSLALLPAARSNLPLWFVLVADQQSYFAPPAALAATNRPLPELPAENEFGRRRELTNASPARPGLIAELSMPGDAAAARSNVSLVVNALKRDAVFGRVDLLSEDLRRSLADPKVVVAERHYALALDFAETAFQPVPRRARGSLTNRPGRIISSGRPGSMEIIPAPTPP